MPLVYRSRRHPWPLTLGPMLTCILGCQPGEPSLEDAPDAGGGQVTEAYCPDAHPGQGRKRVDLLFVVDDSPSMARFLPTLAAELDDFVAVLESPDVDADYRLAITTSSVPGPGCDASEGPALRFESCVDHLDDFLVADASESPGGGDYRELCTQSCALASLATLPTTTEDSPEARPRPWIERTDLDRTNLPEGVDSAEALRCVGLVGAGGCRFESPLEAMWRALDASYTDGDPAEGFVRLDADLMVVFLTSEDDCSVAPAGGEIFAEDGDRVFWPDPDAAEAPSAVCWNAASECVEQEPPWLACEAVSRDASGAITDDPEAAVLHPVDRYVDRLRDLRGWKRSLDPQAAVYVSVIGGVDDNGDLSFRAAGQDNGVEDAPFGIGPGCQAGSAAEGDLRFATPPLRLDTVVEALVGEKFSVCSNDWGVALERLADMIYDQFRPWCGPACIADLDPATATLEHDCVALELRPDAEPRELPVCKKLDGEYLFEDGDYVQPDDATDACAVFRDDLELVDENPYDDLDVYCFASGHRVELRIARRQGHPAPIDTCVRLLCSGDEGCDAQP